MHRIRHQCNSFKIYCNLFPERLYTSNELLRSCLVFIVLKDLLFSTSHYHMLYITVHLCEAKKHCCVVVPSISLYSFSWTRIEIQLPFASFTRSYNPLPCLAVKSHSQFSPWPSFSRKTVKFVFLNPFLWFCAQQPSHQKLRKFDSLQNFFGQSIHRILVN